MSRCLSEDELILVPHLIFHEIIVVKYDSFIIIMKHVCLARLNWNKKVFDILMRHYILKLR